MQSRYILIFLFLLGFGIAPAVQAQQDTRDAEYEAQVVAELERVAPKQTATFTAATAAFDAGEFDRAAELFKQVADAAPEFDHAHRRLGSSLVDAGKVAEGRAELERAIALRRSPENLAAMARALAYPGQSEGSAAEKKRALDLAGQAFRLNARNDPHFAVVFAQLAADLKREAEFREATTYLSTRFPDRMETHYFAAIRALLDGDRAAAEREIRRAEALGMPAGTADEFLKGTEQPTLWSYVAWPTYLVLAWAAGILLLFVLGKALSVATLKWLNESDPNDASAAASSNLRSVYRWLINVAGVYYYVSLPIVILLLAGVAGGVFYGFWSLGHIPIKLVLFIVIGAVATIFYVIRSVFVRARDEDPGRALAEAEAPELWRLARDVARRVGTRPVDEIRITVGTDMAVYEKGSFRERMQDTGRRVLLVGAGVLNDFRVSDFRAVLAHEYGHFQNRDTAGGDVALRVRMSMAKLAESMIASEQATPWNVGFQFLRLYHFVFRRISHGATRLQEVLADRTAVRLYGADAFEGGLRHVIRRGVEFDVLADLAVRDAIKNKRTVSNLYTAPEIEGTDAERTIAKIVDEAMRQPTTDDDTHPAPADRFALARRIRSEAEPEPDGEVWDLFADREAIVAEMCQTVDRNIRVEWGQASYARAWSGDRPVTTRRPA